MEQPLLTERNDLAGNSLLRVCRHQLLARCIPLGNYRGGAGLKCLVVFAVLHYLGRPLFRVLVRFERQLHGLYRVRERLRGRGQEEESDAQGA